MLAAMFTLAWTSCDDDIEYTPAGAVQGAQVYFPSTVASTINLSSTENSYQIPVMRVETSSAMSVAVTATGGEGLYTVPSSVDFAQGEANAYLTISYDAEAIGFDSFTDMTITLGSDTTPYGISTYEFSIGIPAPWTSLGMCTYVDDFLTTMWSTDNTPFTVEIQENDLQPGYFRVVNPYGAAFPFNEEGDWDNSQNWYIEIHAEDPTAVYIPVQETGMDWGEGMMYVGSLAGFYISQGQTLEEVKAAGYTGTYEDGVISFPANSLLFGMANYNDGGLYQANMNGAFRVIMPGVVIADYSVAVAYTGSYTDPNGYNYVLGNVTLGADVEEARVALVAADADVETVAAGMIDESIEYTSVEASGEVRLKAAGNGTYTMVVVSMAEGEGQEVAYTTFIHKATAVTPIDDYVGQWVFNGVVNAAQPAPFTMPVTIAQVAEDSLTVTGSFPLIPGYTETFGLNYDAESGNLLFAAQELSPLQEDAQTLLVPMSLNEGSFTTSETMTGQFDSEGNLVFGSTFGNEGAWDSFAIVLSSEQGASLLAYFANTLAPYTAPAVQTKSVVASTLSISNLSLKRVSAKSVNAKGVDLQISVRNMGNTVSKAIHATTQQAVAFMR